MKLRGKRAVITGGSLGLGRAIAEAFVLAGADVLICARKVEALQSATTELQHLAPAKNKILWQSCDVASEEQVLELAARAQADLGGCDILVNNAGLHGVLGPLQDCAWEAWRRAMESNFFGVALPCHTFIPLLKASGSGRIINISGGGATGPRPFFSAYASAKAAVVRLTDTLAEELSPHGVTVNAIAPGALKTRLTADALKAGRKRIGDKSFTEIQRVQDEGGQPPEVAAELAVLLASDEGQDISGRLISAPWDDWKSLPGRAQDLAASDIFTLRRIEPRDRGQDWSPKK